MRKLLLLALFLYNIITLVTVVLSFDYIDMDAMKRHAMLEDRKSWRQKSLMNDDPKNWDMLERRRHDYFDPNFMDNRLDRSRNDPSYHRNSYRDGHEDDRDPGRKSMTLVCNKPHERYEPCFAGCASITCDNPRDRMRPCYPFCEAGCICVPPYVRDDRTHKCVLPEDCTKGLKGIPDINEDR